MAGDWQRLVRGREFDVGDSSILVRLGERSQKVSVDDEGESYLLSAVVARARFTRAVDDLDAFVLRTWQRNRATALVGYRLDSRDRLIAETWIPKLGLTAEEFQLYVRAIARESDRFEFELTGEDAE